MNSTKLIYWVHSNYLSILKLWAMSWKLKSTYFWNHLLIFYNTTRLNNTRLLITLLIRLIWQLKVSKDVLVTAFNWFWLLQTTSVRYNCPYKSHVIYICSQSLSFPLSMMDNFSQLRKYIHIYIFMVSLIIPSNCF